jgi:hypothetical protein
MNIRDLFKSRETFKDIPFLGLNQWFLVFAGLYLALIAASLLIMRLPGEYIFLRNSRLTGMLFYPFALLSISLIVLKKIGVDFVTELKDWGSNFKTDTLLGLFYFCAYLLLIGLLLALGFGNFMEDSGDAALSAALRKDPLILSVVVFSAVILAPLGEEIAFKRLLYVGMRRTYSVIRAILICSLLFVLLHAHSAFLPMIIFVPVTYYMYERHQRLPANIILHALINLAAVLGLIL